MTSLSCAPNRDLCPSEYLAWLQALCVEVQGGISALMANRLAEFKEHLAKQEQLSARLQEVVKCMTSARVDSDPCFPVPDNELLAKNVRATHLQLANLNRRYAALLSRSSRSVLLLGSHCRTYLDNFAAITRSQPNCHTLSSEL